MPRQAKRRTILSRGAASMAAALLGAHGGDAFTPAGGSRATPLAGTDEDRQVNEQLKDLWVRWAELWNGDLAIADEIIASGFVAHFAPAGNSPNEVRGPQELTEWIGQITAAFTDFSVTTTVGPLADGDLLAGRWIIQGVYQGGIPESSLEAVGKQIAYEGMDLLRVKDGRMVEYWVSADTLDFLQQIGVIPS